MSDQLGPAAMLNDLRENLPQLRDALRELPAAIRYLADRAESGNSDRSQQIDEIRKIRLELKSLHRQRMWLTTAIVLVSAAAVVFTIFSVH
jgi:predicted unusual protein kinase regulating ubiquinone biosynthesis (AarF/ABC1/UbiB family)